MSQWKLAEGLDAGVTELFADIANTFTGVLIERQATAKQNRQPDTHNEREDEREFHIRLVRSRQEKRCDRSCDDVERDVDFEYQIEIVAVEIDV